MANWELYTLANSDAMWRQLFRQRAEAIAVLPWELDPSSSSVEQEEEEGERPHKKWKAAYEHLALHKTSTDSFQDALEFFSEQTDSQEENEIAQQQEGEAPFSLFPPS